MDLNTLQRKRRELSERTDATLNNMQQIAKESARVAEVAHNSRQII